MLKESRSPQPSFGPGRKHLLDGQRALRLVATVSTDDLGNYRLFSLAPGKYYVSAVIRDKTNMRTLVLSRCDRRPFRGTGHSLRGFDGRCESTLPIGRRPHARFVGPSVPPTRRPALQLTPRIPVVNQSTCSRFPWIRARVIFRYNRFLRAATSSRQCPTKFRRKLRLKSDAQPLRIFAVAIPSPIEIRARCFPGRNGNFERDQYFGSSVRLPLGF